ncbi:tetratricopeptide repeat protein 14 isoform X1 [Nerophis ophidion]|uniref:tetratricopeptide repeat protein 14 isoform X1 n=1 Tax=Nerophis ophidion TaxID=159077 RepID=UPI002AE09283|nr:tetratricopeptide repeat protein 14 isoform X1 [Nerophis ophidion]XP_061739822.1 tetratricopeptide repeat protein 14 isoform X1 [Nerophis ophidion]
MDRDLLRQCLTYHGESLFCTLKCEQTENPDFQAVVADLCQAACESNGEGLENPLVEQFIARKADILFCPSWKTATPKEEKHGDEEAAEPYAVMPPLELFMEVPYDERRAMLYRDLERGDIVVGRINNIREYGFFLTLICMAGGMNRDIEDLELSALCHIREIPSAGSHDDPLSYYQIGDLIRAGVKDIDRYQEKITVSLLQTSLPPRSESVQLGVINKDELPLHYNRSVRAASDSRETYERILCGCHGYHNPSVVDYLLDNIGVTDLHPPSMMRGLQSKLFEKEDFACAIREKQSASWALKCVKAGVDHFKHSRHVEAMNEYNKALDIDTNNVEALVARGALYANKGSILKAVSDFELALKTCPDHRNAKKYLCQTLVERGKQLEEQEKLVTAEGVYRRALSLDEANPEAQEALNKITETIQNSIRLREEALTKEAADKAKSGQSSAEKLRKILKEEKRMKRKRKRSSPSPSTSPSSRNSSTSSSSSDHRRSKKKKKKKRRSQRESKRHRRLSSRESSRRSEDGKCGKRRKEKEEDEELEWYPEPPNTSATFLNQKGGRGFGVMDEEEEGEASRKGKAGNGARICLYSLSGTSEDEGSECPSHSGSNYKVKVESSSRTMKSSSGSPERTMRRNSSHRSVERGNEDKRRRSLDERKRKISCSSSESLYSRKPADAEHSGHCGQSKGFPRRSSLGSEMSESRGWEKEEAWEETCRGKDRAEEEKVDRGRSESEQGGEILVPGGKAKKDLPANLLDIFNQIAKFEKDKGVRPKK